MIQHPEHWRPTAPLEHLRARAALYGQIREFFRSRHVLEVDVPIMSQAAVTDPQLDVIEAFCCGQPAYLQTSPEFGLKRLLAAGIGACYSLGKVFRNDEAGGRHNPEFTLLEWYRPGFDDHELMAEMADLLSAVLPPDIGSAVPQFSRYRDIFVSLVGVDPHCASSAELQATAEKNIETDLRSFAGETNRDVWLDLLMTHCIEPRLTGIHFIYDYPASQAALARCVMDEQGVLVARRFELYVQGMELANGYWELTDGEELARRFAADQAVRAEMCLPCRPLDNHLLAAHKAGLPDCAGVAMGIDRLLMVMLGAPTIADVIAFPFTRA